MNKTISSEVLEKLQAVDSPTIANVVELFDVQSRVAGYTKGPIKAVYADLKPIVGYAVTATARTSYPAVVGRVSASPSQILSTGERMPGPKIVVIQDLDETPVSAVYGELLATSFKRFGFSGLITNGAGRDYEQVKPLEFPCFVSSMIVSHGYGRIEEVSVRVTVGGLRVETGNLLHADANGVIRIPLNIAAAVAEMIDPFIASENTVLNYLETVDATPDGWSNAFKEMRNRQAELTKRAQAMIAEERR